MLKKSVCALLCAVVVAGCNVKPDKYTQKEQYDFSAQDLHRLFAGQTSVEKPITLSEAIARAILYNAENRVKRMEIAVATGQLELAKWEMIPSLDGEWLNTHRSNKNQQFLVDADGTKSPNESSVIPENLTTAAIGLNWNIIDFGLSYVHAKQQADRVLIAAEQRRKLTQGLIKDVITAYWKAYNAQRILQEIEAFRDKVNIALSRSEKATEQQIASNEEQMEYQFLLIRSARRLTFFKMQMVEAKQELAYLMNLNPGEDYVLAPPTDLSRHLPSVHASLKKLDTIALVYRPELYELSYQTRIAKNGITEAMMDMLPNLGFNYGYNYNSNEFLVNNKWLNWDVEGTWNFLKLVSGPTGVRLAMSVEDLEKLRRMAMVMSVLTQVRLAVLEYQIWREDYHYAQRESRVAKKLYQLSQNLSKTNAGTEQLMIRRGLVSLNAELDQAVAFAKAQEALAKLQQSLGINIFPPDIDKMTLEEATKVVEETVLQDYQDSFDTVVNARYAEIQAMQEDATQYVDAEAEPEPVA